MVGPFDVVPHPVHLLCVMVRYWKMGDADHFGTFIGHYISSQRHNTENSMYVIMSLNFSVPIYYIFQEV